MVDETTTETPAQEETPEVSEDSQVLAGEDTPEQTTEADSARALAESQAQAKRYKEQVSGSQAEAERLKRENEALKAQQPPQESDSELSQEDRTYRDYLKKLGLYDKDEIAKLVQEKVAPLQAEREARNKTEQTQIINSFIKAHPELENDTKLDMVKDKLKKIAPTDPLNPNLSLSEDLEHARRWALEGETNKEAISKAKSEGRAEGHEASETKVGEGASISSQPAKKQRSPQSEDMLKRFEVDDESLSKKQSETEQK